MMQQKFMFLIKRNITWIKNSDYLVLEYIINKGQIGEEIYDELNHLNNEDIKTSLKILTLEYFGQAEHARYGSPIITKNGNKYILSASFKTFGRYAISIICRRFN